jgi:divalent metal cation (Fe/Co/Zn/Cd) transporter
VARRAPPGGLQPVNGTNLALLRRGLRLEYATLGWNAVGVVVVPAAALAARSVALAGFGLDSGIEIFASVIVVWQLTGTATPARERRALRLIGAAFLALAVYVLVQSVFTLATRGHPHRSPPGIAWLAATFAVMLLLAIWKGRTGRALGSPVLVTESRVTMVDAFLAGSVLVGLVLNAAVGWWWADPVSALVIVYYGVREGRAAFSGGG